MWYTTTGKIVYFPSLLWNSNCVISAGLAFNVYHSFFCCSEHLRCDIELVKDGELYVICKVRSQYSAFLVFSSLELQQLDNRSIKFKFLG